MSELKKSLPKHCTNLNAKARRARSYERGRQRKAAHRNAQRQRERANSLLRAAGQPTPWETYQLRQKLKYEERRAQSSSA